jgi:hypothetical protein
VTRSPAAILVSLLLTAAAAMGGCHVAPEGPTPEPAPGHTWNQTHRVDLPSGWAVAARNVGPTDESTSLSGPRSEGCLVEVSSAKPLWHARPQWPERVQVQGHDAVYGDLDPDYGPYSRAVLWRAADHRWFRVSCDADRGPILAMAERVRSAPSAMLVPFRLTSPVRGLTMTQLIESRDGGRRTVAAQFEVPGTPPLAVLQISNLRDRTLLTGPVEHQQLQGRDVEVRTASQTICLRTRSAPVCVSGPAGEPASGWGSPTARRIAEQTVERLVAVVDPDDEASWWPADKAFPS